MKFSWSCSCYKLMPLVIIQLQITSMAAQSGTSKLLVYPKEVCSPPKTQHNSMGYLVLTKRLGLHLDSQWGCTVLYCTVLYNHLGMEITCILVWRYFWAGGSVRQSRSNFHNPSSVCCQKPTHQSYSFIIHPVECCWLYQLTSVVDVVVKVVDSQLAAWA